MSGMAQRHATRRYPDSLTFLKDWQEQLSMDALLFPSGALEDTPASEMKVDLVLPAGQRVGPITAQLINNFPDGSAAFRLSGVPDAVKAAVGQATLERDKWRDYLLSTGEVRLASAEAQPIAAPAPVEPARAPDVPAAADAVEVASLRQRIVQLEAEVLRQRAAAAQAGQSSGSRSTPTANVRGLLIPDTSGIPIYASGALGDKSLRNLFMRLSVEKPTGLLTLSLPDGFTRWSFIQKGGPVGFRTDPMDEQEVLGVLLYKAGSITVEQLAESLRVMEERGCRQGEALIEMGVFTFAQLVLVLQKQCEFVLVRLLAEASGTWTFHALDELPERFIAPPMRVAAHLFRDLRTKAKTIAADTLANFLRPLYEQYVYIRPGVERTLDEMRLSAEEQAFLKIVGATSYRVREMPSVSNLSRGQTASMLWCLTELGLLEFREDAAAARSEERFASLIASRKATIDKGSYFDQLEVHWMGTSDDVEKAWRRFKTEFPEDNPDKYGEKLRPDVLRIIAGVQKAYETLSNEAKRREYRATRIERVMIEQSAIMLAGKGDMALMKENMVEAWDCFSKAAELMPNVASYRAGAEQSKSGRR
jgi:hypothetical protein